MQPSFKFRLTNMNNVWGNLATWIRGYMDYRRDRPNGLPTVSMTLMPGIIGSSPRDGKQESAAISVSRSNLTRLIQISSYVCLESPVPYMVCFAGKQRHNGEHSIR